MTHSWQRRRIMKSRKAADTQRQRHADSYGGKHLKYAHSLCSSQRAIISVSSTAPLTGSYGNMCALLICVSGALLTCCSFPLFPLCTVIFVCWCSLTVDRCPQLQLCRAIYIYATRHCCKCSTHKHIAENTNQFLSLYIHIHWHTCLQLSS